MYFLLKLACGPIAEMIVVKLVRCGKRIFGASLSVPRRIWRILSAFWIEAMRRGSR